MADQALKTLFNEADTHRYRAKDVLFTLSYPPPVTMLAGPCDPGNPSLALLLGVRADSQDPMDQRAGR